MYGLQLSDCGTVLGRVPVVDLNDIKKGCGQLQWGLFVSNWGSGNKR